MMPARPPLAGASPRKPPRQVVLPPSAFASDWGSRPDAPVAIGLRFVSVEDERIARATGIAMALKQIAPQGKVLDRRALDEAYNDEVILCIVARAMCDANDVERPFELMPVAEDQIARAMTPAGVRRLWDELGILHAGSGVAIPPAPDDVVGKLAGVLRKGQAILALTPAHALEVRKLVTSMLERLSPHDDGLEADWEPPPSPDPEIDGEDEVASFDVKE